MPTKLHSGLAGKRILITAGPTWVPIDSVRVISNSATGNTGIMLAQHCLRAKAKVTLLLGPVGNPRLDSRIRVLRFTFFDELHANVKRELRRQAYDIIIHSAAVADFMPARVAQGKLGSGKAFSLKLTPLPKIINDIRSCAPKAEVVMFKLEIGLKENQLIGRARAALKKSQAQYCVANTLEPYRAFILDRQGNKFAARSKPEMVKKLCHLLQLKKGVKI